MFSNLTTFALTVISSLHVGHFAKASPVDGSSFLQLKHESDSNLAPAPSQGYCTDLMNMGTHFTVRVEVGTPPQSFDVVADTGSNNLIVPSCICNDNSRCESVNRCFRGTNRSSTFEIDDIDGAGPPVMMLSFGSGDIEAAVATDVARVDGLQVKMNSSLLLMIDQALSFGGQFEGILGLGLPQTNRSMMTVQSGAGDAEQDVGLNASADDAAIKEIIDQIINGIGAGQGFNAVQEGKKAVEHASLPNMALAPVQQHRAVEVRSIQGSRISKNESGSEPLQVEAPQSFLERAGVSHFSMCFNDDAANGTLRLGTAPKQNALGSIGQEHWGLDFRGITVGSGHQKVHVDICSKENMTDGQETPCGAIPDSGTTAIMAPQDHLDTLMDSICDSWERCATNHTLYVEAKQAAHEAAVGELGFDPFGIGDIDIPKSLTLQLLLQDCGSWLTEEEGVNELPVLKFDIRGSDGEKQVLELTGWGYVLESEQPILERIYQEFPGFGEIPIGANATGETEKVCSLSFGEMDYNTQRNGPVWILGTPFFYEFNVGYDLASTPPSVSFTSHDEEPCAPCNPAASLLADSGNSMSAHHKRRPRQMKGEWRMPHLDLSRPL